MYANDTQNANPWEPCSVAPISTLANLRDAVLERSEKRSPKWKFRLAPDLILQVQPKAATRCRFECVAVMCEGATAAVFSSPRALLARDWWKMSFDVVVEPQGEWRLKPRGFGWRLKAERAGCRDLRGPYLRSF